MSYNRQMYIGLISFIALTILIGGIFVYTRLNDQKVQLDKLQQIVNERTMIADLLKGNIKMHYTYDEYQFDNFILRSIDRKEIPISVLLNGGNKLVYKFSAINCSSCIQFGLSMIQQITHKITKEQLIIIADSSNRREIQALVSSLKLDYPVYLVEQDVFKNILSKENVPFFFIIDKKLRMKDLFIPVKEMPEYSEMYYTIIWRKYFNR